MSQDEALSPDGLFEIAPSAFVAARDKLVKALRAAKRTDEAQAVKRLTKPPASVWATNRVARSAPQAVRRLLDAAEALRQAQATGDARDLRAAATTHRQRLDELVAEATKTLAEAGQRAAPGVLERVAGNFRDGALVPEAREPLVAGRLSRDVEPVDIGVLLGGLPVRPAAPTARPPTPSRSATTHRPSVSPPAARKPPPDTSAARRQHEEHEARRRATRALEEARRQAETARRSALVTQDRQQAAVRAVDQARTALQRAEQVLTEAEQAHAQAALTAETKQRERVRLEDELGQMRHER